MNIDEVVKKLLEYKEKHGNIKVRVAGSIDYWGTTYNEVNEYTLRHEESTSLNPKKLERTEAIVFCFGYDC